MNELQKSQNSEKSPKPGEEYAPKVLIIDDEPAALHQAKTMLARATYDVVTCKSAVEALKVLETQPIDCIITDVVMPVMDGYELARAIRANADHARTPILMLTRKRAREDVSAALQAGVDDYILKPIDEQLLLDKIESNIKKGNSKRHIFKHNLHESENGKAELKLSARIMSISEADVTVHTTMMVDERMPLELSSQVFDEMGIRPPILRLLQCRKIETPIAVSIEYPYEARYSFLGVAENDLRKIRAWLHRQALNRRK